MMKVSSIDLERYWNRSCDCCNSNYRWPSLHTPQRPTWPLTPRDPILDDTHHTAPIMISEVGLLSW